MTDFGDDLDIISPANQIDCILSFFSVHTVVHIAYHFLRVHYCLRFSTTLYCHNGRWQGYIHIISTFVVLILRDVPQSDHLEEKHEQEFVELRFRTYLVQT
jgi:hypothetical protein